MGQRSSRRRNGGPAHVVTGDLQRGRERRDQVRPQPVQQPAFVPVGPLVVPGDGPQLGGHRAVRDQRPQRGEPVQRQQARDPGVLRVVLLPGRATPPGDQVRVHRDHREPGVQQLFHQHPVAGLDHHPHLGRVRLQPDNPGQQGGHRASGCAPPGSPRTPRSPVDPGPPGGTARPSRSPRPTSDASFRASTNPDTKARRRADGPVLTGRHRCGRQAFRGHPPGTPSHDSPQGTSNEAFPEGDLS